VRFKGKRGRKGGAERKRTSTKLELNNENRTERIVSKKKINKGTLKRLGNTFPLLSSVTRIESTLKKRKQLKGARKTPTVTLKLAKTKRPTHRDRTITSKLSINWKRCAR